MVVAKKERLFWVLYSKDPPRSSLSLIAAKRCMVALSGLQLDVLALYRTLLRTARKVDKSGSGELGQFVGRRFREKATQLSKYDFKLIEHQLRWGYKQKKLMESPGFSSASAIKK